MFSPGPPGAKYFSACAWYLCDDISIFGLGDTDWLLIVVEVNLCIVLLVCADTELSLGVTENWYAEPKVNPVISIGMVVGFGLIVVGDPYVSEK